MLTNLDSEAKRNKIYAYLEKANGIAYEKFVSEDLNDSERLGWGRLVVQLLHEMSNLVKTDLLEKNREDIENIKTLIRLKGDDL